MENMKTKHKKTLRRSSRNPLNHTQTLRRRRRSVRSSEIHHASWNLVIYFSEIVFLMMENCLNFASNCLRLIEICIKLLDYSCDYFCLCDFNMIRWTSFMKCVEDFRARVYLQLNKIFQCSVASISQSQTSSGLLLLVLISLSIDCFMTTHPHQTLNHHCHYLSSLSWCVFCYSIAWCQYFHFILDACHNIFTLYSNFEIHVLF